jgi:putative heme-binding domain-containing protein
LQPGDSQIIPFEAPKQVGVYPIVCTYPGHWRRMHAALYVVDSLDEFRDDATALYEKYEPLIKDPLLKLIGKEYEWTIEELVESVKPLQTPRSFEVGQSVFKLASCATCHRMGEKEGLQIGPDLTKLDTTQKNTESILRSVIQPAEKIEKEFQSNVFILDTGITVQGMILEETDDTITVIENPLAKTKPMVIEKDEIEERAKVEQSIMPEALTNRLNREELLDLIAYVYAKGDKNHKIFEGQGCHGETGCYGDAGASGHHAR